MKNKDKKRKKEKEFFSITEVEKEFFPANTTKKKEKSIIGNIKKKAGSRLMTDILSSYLK